MEQAFSERSNIGKTWYLLRGIGINPAYVFFPIALSLLAATFEGAGMGLLIPILNGFLNKSFSFVLDAPIIGPLVGLLPTNILQNDRLIFGVLLTCFIVIYILRNILRYLTLITMGFFSERCLHHLRKTLFSKYLSFGKLFFDTTNVGHHNTILMEFSQLALRPLSMIDKYMNALFSLCVYSIVMLSISWRLTLIALPLFILLHIAVRGMVLTIRRHSREISIRGSELGKKSVEILSTIALVKSYRTEHLEQVHYTKISDEKSKLDFQVRALHGVILPLQEIITLLAASAIFVGALILIGRDQIASAPALIVYFYVVLNAASKFGTLSGFRGTLAAATGPLDEVLTIFDERGKFFVHSGVEEYTGLQEAIVWNNLTFSYAEGRTVLRDLSLVIHKGQMTAVVGPTGAGKSTFINLLLRYYDCPPRSILIDGKDIRSFTLDSYLAKVAIVSQETLLLHDSLRNNIAYGLEGISDEAIRDVVQRARLEEYVSRLPEGLDTLVGDRGVKLSGGEKQRVSIARALLKGAEILILDEATSSLDSQTEKLIQEAIDEAVQGRTSIVIAHRLSTIRNADKIVVLQDGGLVEEGTLEELLKRKGAFFRLWEEQRF